jgi:TRAP-type mannitol/chloroaromatic compound transport system permease small subunit
MLEILFGSVLTFLVILSVRKFIDSSKITKNFKIKYTQSHIFELMPLEIHLAANRKQERTSQSTEHFKKSISRVVFYENSAYWIAKNGLVRADIVDGVVRDETTKIVDTIGMDKVQLNNIEFIVEKLTEGNENDNRSSGN